MESRQKFAVSKELLLMFLYLIIIGAGIYQTYQAAPRSAFAPPAGKKVVLIDAGHGGWDSGKQSTAAHESELNLAVAEKLQAYFEVSGSFVVTTRASDTALGSTKREDLSARAKLADELGADLLISIHHNSYPEREIRGAQTFYYGDSEESKKLAELIQAELKAIADPANKREAKPNMDYYILKHSKTPAVIVECGFMSNPEEEALLNDGDYQNKIAWAIYCGVVKYFGLN